MNLLDYEIRVTGLHTIVLKDKECEWPDIHPFWADRIEPKTVYNVCMRNDGLCVVTREDPENFHQIFLFGSFITDEYGYIYHSIDHFSLNKRI